MRLVTGFVVCRVEVADTGLEARLHDREVLIRQGHVDDHVGLEVAHERNQSLHVVGIDGGGRYVGFAYGDGHGVALALGAGRDHNLLKNVAVLAALVDNYAGYTAAADDQCSSHC